MRDGFDLDSPLVCEGIIGDSCGGGRIFFVKDSTLFAYDSITKESILLLESVIDAVKIFKKACHITIECRDETIVFDLSQLTRIK